jgi:hypothetical protein
MVGTMAGLCTGLFSRLRLVEGECGTQRPQILPFRPG